MTTFLPTNQKMANMATNNHFNAAHELKTPAMSIHGYLESILDNPDMPEDKRKHFLERCYAQSERMNKLLLDMSALTKLDEMDANHFRNSEEYQQIMDKEKQKVWNQNHQKKYKSKRK
ncbi:MAG: hypothetical protein IJ154_08495 [Bacteroidales bacterium]|nr:hypothetical protein [Bacteroidales bacterium]